MDLKKIIKEIFQTESFILEKTNKGYTNKNYKLYIDKKTYMVRVPWEHSEHIVNHQHEEKTIKAIQDLSLDVPLVFFDSQTGIKITEYIDGLWEFQECPYPDKIKRVAYLMKQLHQAKLQIHESFNPIERFYEYRKHLQHPLYDVDRFESIIFEVKQLHNPHVLCHNDWVSGNLLFSNTRDYLIDYEYGADNDPLFDVMSFISENNIDNVQERELFYKTYFNQMNDVIREQLCIWENFHNLLWCTWAMMMWEQRQEQVYKKIAHTKYQALCNSFLHPK